MSAEGDHTRAGEPLREAWGMAGDVAEIVAMGVNCCDPDDVGTALAGVAGPRVAYPNSGQGWDAVRRAWTGDSAFDAGAVTGWVDGGARLVGGCCRVGPGDIASVATTIAASVAGRA
jgi:homocysteine S-methyltransferase